MNSLASFLIFIIFLSSCSFDNKTGIWEDASQLKNVKKKELRKKNLQDVFTENKIFEEEQEVNSKIRIEIERPLKNKYWIDKYFSSNNNTPNIYYENKKHLLSRSSKLSKPSINMDFLFYDDSIISFDKKGKIYIYSINQKKKIFEYYFYKKKFKKYKKEINITINDGKIYASDNLGYVYVIEINSKKLIWAKYFGIPFRSNIKVVDNRIFLADQDNKLYSIKSSNGDKIWEFATSLTKLKFDFENNILVDKKNKNLFFLNTNGELYSINYLSQEINWFLNLKTKNSNIDTSLFLGLPLVKRDNNILVSTGNSLLNYNSLSGSKIWKKNIPLAEKGVLTKNNVFLFTKNNLLICLDIYTGKIIWSSNIFNQIKILDKKNLSKKIKKISNLIITSNEIFLFSSEGYLLSFDYKNGKINSISRILKSGLGSRPIFADGHMYLIDKNNRVFKYN